MSNDDEAADRFDFRNCNFYELNRIIQQVDWSFALSPDVHDVNSATETFYSRINDILSQHVPVSRRTVLKKFIWWNRELSNSKNRLRKARKKYRNNPTESTKQSLRSTELQYLKLKDTSYRQYLADIQNRFKVDPSAFWKYVKSKRGSQGLPLNLSYLDRKSNNTKEAVQLCADFFKSTFVDHLSSDNEEYLSTISTFDINIPETYFSPDDVKKALLDINEQKGAGPDGLSPLFIKRCCDSLALPISMLFNNSLSTKTFPNIWKTAAITPIHKSGNVNNVENYRAISILNCLAKIFELMIFNKMNSISSRIISEKQHGFRKKRSTLSNLMVYVPFVSRALANKIQVDSIYIDFSKAFDRLPHKLLIEKLDKMGFPTWLVQWLGSYLRDRSAYVRQGSAKSQTFRVTSGVPQGSHLGPLLFNLFMNDLCGLVQSELLLYADDLKLYRMIGCFSDCLLLQQDLDIILRWCEINRMEMNSQKCKVLTFTRSRQEITHQYTVGSTELAKVQSIRDLGVIMDKTLAFKEQLSVTVAKAKMVLGFIVRHTKGFGNITTLKVLFCSLARSVLEYNIQIWAPNSIGGMKLLESVQKRFLRYALPNLPWNDPLRLPPYQERCGILNLEPIGSRVVFLRRLIIFDILSGNIDCADLTEMIPLHVPSRPLRIYEPLRLLNYGRNVFYNPFDICCKLFNQVYSCFDFNISKDSFKNRLRTNQSE